MQRFLRVPINVVSSKLNDEQSCWSNDALQPWCIATLLLQHCSAINCCNNLCYSLESWILGLCRLCSYLLGCVPISSNIFRAILLCKFHCSTATATIIPPINSTLVSLKYTGLISFAFTTPNTGKSKSGRRAVTAKEHVSVVQYTAMMIMAYAQRLRCKKNI